MLELKAVCRSFPGRGPRAERVHAVRDVSFVVEDGQTLCLIGTSGCGKSTTLKMINRLIEPSAGEIHIDGVDARGQELTALRRRIGYVIQQIGLFPHMTVADNIGLVPHLEGWPPERIRERVETLMALAHLPYQHFAHRYPRELSGGQQQRVGVIRALALDPAHLLMDEPFGALDPITRESIQDEFVRLQREVKKTIVVVTHDLAEAFKLGTHVGVMDGGHLVQKGPPEDLLARPATPFVEQFLKTQMHAISSDRTPVTQALDATARIEREPSNGGPCVIVDENGRLRGVLKSAAPETWTARLQHVEPLTSSSTLREGLRAMLASDSPLLPVVDEARRVVGAVTRESLAARLP